MCTLVVLRNRVDEWPLVLGANRDEVRDRPWEGPTWDGRVLMPRDLRAGGSWIALHEKGLLVAVTNRPDPDPDPGRPSRGLLARDLAREGSVEAARTLIREDLERVRRNAFHVLLASAEECWVGIHPDPEGGPIEERPVPSGLHHVTNLWGLDELDHRGAFRPLELKEGVQFEVAIDRMKEALRSHEDRGPGGPDTICKHGPERGTLSSSIIALPEKGKRKKPIWLFAAGAPCETSYRSVE